MCVQLSRRDPAPPEVTAGAGGLPRSRVLGSQPDPALNLGREVASCLSPFVNQQDSD